MTEEYGLEEFRESAIKILDDPELLEYCEEQPGNSFYALPHYQDSEGEVALLGMRFESGARQSEIISQHVKRGTESVLTDKGLKEGEHEEELEKLVDRSIPDPEQISEEVWLDSVDLTPEMFENAFYENYDKPRRELTHTPNL